MADRHQVGDTRLGAAEARLQSQDPGRHEEVAAVLSCCNDAHVPVSAAGGRSGVCGSSVPVFGGVALDMTGIEGVVDVDTTSCVADVRAGTFGPDLERRSAGRGNDSRALAAVDGPFDGRRMDRVPRCGSVLHPLREDRGHGDRPDGRAR